MKSVNRHNTIKEKVVFRDLGRIGYKEAWDLQTDLNQKLIEWKRGGDGKEIYQPHYLLFCEHNPVFTLGKTGKESHLLAHNLSLGDKSIEFFKINRGGDITYHGPGQIVGYPIFDLDRIFTDIHRYIRSLEEVMILTLAEYGLKGTRVEGYTGVWLEDEGKNQFRKICAIGVHLSRWVTMHGFAFNVNTDLQFFDLIVPCGIQDHSKSVTSLRKELGREISMNEVKDKMRNHFAAVFALEYQPEPSPKIKS